MRNTTALVILALSASTAGRTDIQKGTSGSPEVLLDPNKWSAFIMFNLGVTPKF